MSRPEHLAPPEIVRPYSLGTMALLIANELIRFSSMILWKRKSTPLAPASRRFKLE